MTKEWDNFAHIIVYLGMCNDKGIRTEWKWLYYAGAAKLDYWKDLHHLVTYMVHCAYARGQPIPPENIDRAFAFCREMWYDWPVENGGKCHDTRTIPT